MTSHNVASHCDRLSRESDFDVIGASENGQDPVAYSDSSSTATLSPTIMLRETILVFAALLALAATTQVNQCGSGA